MTPDLIAGIDPGLTGAITLLTLEGAVVGSWPTPQTEHEVVELLSEFAPRIARAAIERVQPMPTGTVAMFKLGCSYGLLRGILTTLQIPFDEIPPKQWQAGLGVVLKAKKAGESNKTITRQKAQQLFPKQKITNANADSLLIAEYGRRMR